METLQAFFAANGGDIHTIGRYIQQHVNENWDTVYRETRQEMLDRYDEIGDSVYGIYGAHLFRHIHAEFKTLKLRATPRLPGNFAVSREWGDETDRQRWMWSKITQDGAAIGTIVTAFYHDHEQIRIPRPFQIVALKESTPRDVAKALSALSADFAKALEARVEYAQYLQSTD